MSPLIVLTDAGILLQLFCFFLIFKILQQTICFDKNLATKNISTSAPAEAKEPGNEGTRMGTHTDFIFSF